MIGFSIMMCFVSSVVLVIAVSLLSGNISSLHGKVFDNTEDKVGYGKQLGKLCLFICIGLLICGIGALVVRKDMAIIYVLVVPLVIIVLSAIWFILIQKRYMS